MSVKLSSKMYFGLIVLAVVVALGAVRYISALKPTMQMSQIVEVKAMQVMKQDITTNYDFVGQVKSKNEI